ncbi:MAG: hypothetical protein M3Y81_19410 [Chloroflexota bacterium]|nr:hypothetical protein [Chloroflexota bacterium]
MDVDQLKQLIQQYFVQPLNHLPIAQIKLLETNHDQSVRDCQNAIGALFAPGGPSFEGKTADAVAEYIGTYLNAEEALSPYAGNGLSARINELLRDSATTLDHIEPKLRALQNNAAWAAAGAAVATGEVAAAPEELGAPPTIPLVQLLIMLGAATVFVWASADQQNQINDLTESVNAWIAEMQTLAQQADPPGSRLPGPPSKIEAAITLDAVQLLFNAAKGRPPVDPRRRLSSLSDLEWVTLRQYLTSKYGCSAGEIQAILNTLGTRKLTVQQLEIILQVLHLKAQMQGLHDQMTGYNVSGITRLQALLDRAIKAIEDGNPYSWTQTNLNTWLGQLQTVGAEWGAIQALGPNTVTGIEVRHPGSGPVDFETTDGTWYESKMEGNIRFDDLLDQLSNYARAGAPALGIVVPENAPKNIGYLLLEALRKRGFKQYGEVKVIRVPPYNPLNPGGWCSLPDRNYIP